MTYQGENGSHWRISGDNIAPGSGEPSRLVTHPEATDLAWDQTVESMRADVNMSAEERARIAARVETFLGDVAAGTVTKRPE